MKRFVVTGKHKPDEWLPVQEIEAEEASEAKRIFLLEYPNAMDVYVAELPAKGDEPR